MGPMICVRQVAANRIYPIRLGNSFYQLLQVDWNHMLKFKPYGLRNRGMRELCRTLHPRHNLSPALWFVREELRHHYPPLNSDINYRMRLAWTSLSAHQVCTKSAWRNSDAGVLFLLTRNEGERWLPCLVPGSRCPLLLIWYPIPP